MTKIHDAIERVANGEPVVFIVMALADTNVNEKNEIQQTALHWALKIVHVNAQATRLQVITLLVEAGAQVNIVDDLGQLPLHIAIGLGYTDVAVYLIEQSVQQGFFLDAVDKNDQTPLSLAVSMGAVDIMTVLLANGANLQQKNRKHQTLLYRAAASVKYNAVRLLLAKGLSPHNGVPHATTYGTPLSICLHNGGADDYPYDSFEYKNHYINRYLTIKALLAGGAVIPDSAKGFYKSLRARVWLMAAGCNRVDVLSMLLNDGIENVDFKWHGGVTALHEAAFHGQADVVRFLLDRGADSSVNAGQTPLICAYDRIRYNRKSNEGKSSYFQIIANLLMHKAYQGISNKMLANFLLRAILSLDSANVKMLVVAYQQSGLSLNCHGEDGYTPLTYAALANFTSAMLILIKYGADIRAENLDGTNALIQASKERCVLAANFLLEEEPSLIYSCDRKGNTALHYVIETYDPHIADTNSIQTAKIINTLIAYKASFFKPNSAGLTLTDIFILRHVTAGQGADPLFQLALAYVTAKASNNALYHINQHRAKKGLAEYNNRYSLADCPFEDILPIIFRYIVGPSPIQNTIEAKKTTVAFSDRCQTIWSFYRPPLVSSPSVLNAHSSNRVCKG